MSNETLVSSPEDSKPLRVLLICRTSCRFAGGGATARAKRPDDHDQLVFLREWLCQNISGPVDITIVNAVSIESNLEESLASLQSGRHDLILVASLGRIARGFGLLRFFEVAARQKIRIVAVADSVDSMGPHCLLAATLAYQRDLHCNEMARRIRRSRGLLRSHYFVSPTGIIAT